MVLRSEPHRIWGAGMSSVMGGGMDGLLRQRNLFACREAWRRYSTMWTAARFMRLLHQRPARGHVLRARQPRLAGRAMRRSRHGVGP